MPGQFYIPPDWRWVVTDLDANIITFLDKLAIRQAVDYDLGLPACAKVVVPSGNPEVNIVHTDGYPFVAEGVRLMFGFRREDPVGGPVWVVRFGGIILQVEDNAETEVAETHITAWDPRMLANLRPVLNTNFVLPGPRGLSYTDTMVENIVDNLWDNVGGDADGPLPYLGLQAGTYDAPAEESINFPQGTMLGEAWSRLEQAGYCDVVLTPVWSPGDGLIADLNVYALAGTTRDDAVFAWDAPGKNLIGISNLYDGTQRANNVQMFTGQGGVAPGAVSTSGVSEGFYGEYWYLAFQTDLRVKAAVQALKTQILNIRYLGKQTLKISATAQRCPIPFQEFYLGDVVPIWATDRLRQAQYVYSRVYGFTIEVGIDAPERVSEVRLGPTVGD